MERVKAQLGEASCINYQVDLALPIKMHTIPRHFTVIVSPADDVNVYANTEVRSMRLCSCDACRFREECPASSLAPGVSCFQRRIAAGAPV